MSEQVPSKEQFTDLLLELEHAAEVYGQSGGQSALHSVREARAAVLAAWPTPEPPAVLRAPVDGPFEPWSAADGRRGVMDAHNGITFVVHGFVDDNELRTYCEQLSSTLNARTAQPPPAELNVEKLARDAGFKTGQGSYHLNISGTDENLRRFAELVRSAQPPAPALAEYTHAIGDAAEAYLKSRGGDPLRLPGSFYWMELWNAMRAAACSGITKSGDAT